MLYTQAVRPKLLSFVMTFSGCAIYTGSETKMAQLRHFHGVRYTQAMRPKWLSFVMTFQGVQYTQAMRPKWLSFVMTFSGCAIYTGNETKMAQFCYDIFRVCNIHRQ